MSDHQTLRANRIFELENQVRLLKSEIAVVRQEDEQLAKTCAALREANRQLKIDLKVIQQTQAKVLENMKENLFRMMRSHDLSCQWLYQAASQAFCKSPGNKTDTKEDSSKGALPVPEKQDRLSQASTTTTPPSQDAAKAGLSPHIELNPEALSYAVDEFEESQEQEQREENVEEHKPVGSHADKFAKYSASQQRHLGSRKSASESIDQDKKPSPSTRITTNENEPFKASKRNPDPTIGSEAFNALPKLEQNAVRGRAKKAEMEAKVPGNQRI